MYGFLRSRKGLNDSKAMKQQIEAGKNDVENKRGKINAKNSKERIKVDDINKC